MDETNEISPIELDKIESIKSPKRIDIFSHLKLGIVYSHKNCGCDPIPGKNMEKYYCIPCKLSCCPNCSLSVHQKHLLIKKSQFMINKTNVNLMFEPMDNILENDALFTNCISDKNHLLKEVDNTYLKLLEIIKQWKEFKEKEITNLFDTLSGRIDEMNKKKSEIKKQILDFMTKNETFFNSNPSNKNYNRDMNNTVFLISYDLLTLSNDWSEESKSLSKILERNILDYESNEKTKNEVLIKRIEDLLSIENNFKINLDINSEIFIDQDVDEKLIPYNLASIDLVKFNADSLKNVEKRIYRYEKLIEALKNTVYISLKKHGDYRIIERENNMMENTKIKGADKLFSQRKNNKKIDDYFSSIKKKINSKDDVTLDNNIVVKYFANLMSDLYGNYFKMAVKDLQSSHADLKIKLNEEEEEFDTAKIIEGTNQIYIYDKKLQKMTRKILKLAKNPYGYTKFPYGCRSILLGDKLYITGGRTETQEFPNVLIYDRKTDNLKRIMDLNYPRSYHSLIFNDTFETIMIIGGEYCDAVEIFDPLTNRWQILPPLNIPRCNPLFFFDEPRGYMYVLFGIEGNYINGNYIDSIEVLDLADIRQGWMRVNYENKANMDLKCYLNIYKLNDELFLIYGGMEGRLSKRNVCLYNTSKNEVTKIGRELMEELRKQAKNSRKLTSLISTISKESIV